MNTESEINPSIQKSIKLISRTSLVLVFALCLWDIIVRIIKIPIEEDLLFDLTFVYPDITIGILICALSILLMMINPGRKTTMIITSSSGIIVTIIALLILVSYFDEFSSWLTVTPGKENILNQIFSLDSRMELMTAINFFFFGILLLLVAQPANKRLYIAHILAFIPMVLSYIVLAGHLLKAFINHEFLLITHSFATALAFALMCIIIFSMHPGTWFMRTFTFNKSGNRMARLLLPGVILIPLIIAWFRVSGERAGIFDSEIGVLFVATTYTLIITSLIWLAAFLVNRTEAALRSTEETMRLAQKVAFTGTWDWDINGNSIQWTPEMFELFGLDPGKDKATFEIWEQILHPDDKEVAYDRIDKAVKNGTFLDSTYRIIRPDGNIKWIRATGEARYDHDGNPIRMLGICQDVTTVRLAEEALRLSEERYRRLFNSMIEGFCIIEMVYDHEGKPVDYIFLETNPAFELQTGLQNIVGKKVTEVLPENEQYWYEFYGEVAITGKARSFENESKGLHKWYEVLAYKVGDEESRDVAILFNDISERKIIEEQRLAETLRALALSEISRLFNEIPFNLAEILHSVAKSIAEYIGDACIITRVSEDNEWLHPVAYYHPDPVAIALMDAIVANRPIKMGIGNVGKVAQTGQSIMVAGFSQEQIKEMIKPEYYHHLDKYGIYDYFIVPIKYEGKVMGTIGVIRLAPNKSYSTENQAFLESIAGRVALAISNSLLYKALQDSHDELEIKVLERTSQLNDALTVLSREQKLFRSVLDMLPSYVALLTPDYHFSFTNKEFIRRFGNHKGNHCFKHLFAREVPCEVCHTYEVLNTGKSVTWEWEGPDKCVYHIIDLPFTDADGSGMILEIGTDITKIKQAEDDRIAREVAEQANAAKSLFLANISHEIRTPMNAIIGFSDLLMMNIKDEKQKSQIDVIRSSGKQLLSLINDILDLSKIEAGKMVIQPEPFTFSLFIEVIERLFSKKAEDKGISFITEIMNEVPAILILDENRLRQVLNNLLDNAIKFTHHGHVKLIVDKKLKNDARMDLIISVEDTGIGIPDDQHEVIFKAFNRQTGLSEKLYQGTGLGLTITQRLVELMGGSISLSSTPGKGSIFTIHLPETGISHAKFKTIKHEKELDISAVKFQKALVLVADDNFENRKLLADLLESTSLEILEASNGKEAVDLAIRSLPDLILMDLRMPEMNGYEATEILKSTETTKSIPVVAISASPKIVTRGVSNKDIFDDFILKPANMVELVEVLKKHLAHRIDEREPVKGISLETINAAALTNDQKRALVDLVITLEQDFLPLYSEVLADQVLGKIESFGNNLAELAEKSELNLLSEYAGTIIKSTNDFDVEALMNTLRLFPSIIDKLKELTK
jgi:PAS domain S-box-containing protein